MAVWLFELANLRCSSLSIWQPTIRLDDWHAPHLHVIAQQCLKNLAYPSPSLPQFTFLLDDWGVPLNYRHMEGFGVRGMSTAAVLLLLCVVLCSMAQQLPHGGLLGKRHRSVEPCCAAACGLCAGMLLHLSGSRTVHKKPPEHVAGAHLCADQPGGQGNAGEVPLEAHLR